MRAVERPVSSSGQEAFSDEPLQNSFGRLSIEAEDEARLLGVQRQAGMRHELVADAF